MAHFIQQVLVNSGSTLSAFVYFLLLSSFDVVYQFVSILLPVPATI